MNNIDRLTRESTRHNYLYRDFIIQVNDYVASLKKTYINIFNRKIREIRKRYWYKGIHDIPFKSNNRTPWFKYSKLNKSNIITIWRIGIVHAITNSRLFQINQYFTPMCLRCTTNKNFNTTTHNSWIASLWNILDKPV